MQSAGSFAVTSQEGNRYEPRNNCSNRVLWRFVLLFRPRFCRRVALDDINDCRCEQTMTQGTWQPIETCPENVLVLLWRGWDECLVAVDRFRWVEYSEWETVSESSGKSGARRQIRQETIKREREWDQGGMPEYWMPLPEPPST